jgi:hypothetical protein
MKPLIILFTLTSALLADSVTINGVVIELPKPAPADSPVMIGKSTVAPLLTNPDMTQRVEAIAGGLYNGTSLAREARGLLVRVQRQGMTDENVAAVVELEQKRQEIESASESQVVPIQRQPMDPKRTAFNVAIATGFDTGMGFKLAIGDADRNAFTQMLVLVNTAKEKGVINDTTAQTIADIEGKPHTVTTAQFTGLMLAYGAYYKGLWDRLKTGN